MHSSAEVEQQEISKGLPYQRVCSETSPAIAASPRDRQGSPVYHLLGGIERSSFDAAYFSAKLCPKRYSDKIGNGKTPCDKNAGVYDGIFPTSGIR